MYAEYRILAEAKPSKKHKQTYAVRIVEMLKKDGYQVHTSLEKDGDEFYINIIGRKEA